MCLWPYAHVTLDTLSPGLVDEAHGKKPIESTDRTQKPIYPNYKRSVYEQMLQGTRCVKRKLTRRSRHWS